MSVQQPVRSSHRSVDETDTPSILIVDDEPDIVGFLHDLLESEGYRVQDAFDGHQAIGILEHTTPHLIISDVRMPRADGQDLLRFIDRIPHEPAPKIILMSATGKPSAAPEIPFISKPFDIEDLLDLVDSAFDDHFA